jgi:hypothetical protein
MLIVMNFAHHVKRTLLSSGLTMRRLALDTPQLPKYRIRLSQTVMCLWYRLLFLIMWLSMAQIYLTSYHRLAGTFSFVIKHMMLVLLVTSRIPQESFQLPWCRTYFQRFLYFGFVCDLTVPCDLCCVLVKCGIDHLKGIGAAEPTCQGRYNLVDYCAQWHGLLCQRL